MANVSTFSGLAPGERHSSVSGPFRRVFAAMIESRQRQADREVAAFLARHDDHAAGASAQGVKSTGRG